MKFMLKCYDEILHLKYRNLGQILHVDKTCFLWPGHIYEMYRVEKFLKNVRFAKFVPHGLVQFVTLNNCQLSIIFRCFTLKSFDSFCNDLAKHDCDFV